MEHNTHDKCGYVSAEIERTFSGVRDSSPLDHTVFTLTHHPFGHRLAITNRNIFRKIWNGVIALLLVYVGSVFPYILCFRQFGYPPRPPLSQGWTIFEQIVDVLFYMDLFVYFFFTYKDREGREVMDLRLIAGRYLRGLFFFLNLIACLPPSLINVIADSLSADSNGSGVGSFSSNEAMRVTRLPSRVSRLARLVRLTRLAKIASFMKNSTVWQSLQSIRGVRILHFTIGLFSVVHLLACGWYLCAVLYPASDMPETWLGRRTLADSSALLLNAPPGVQWLHAVYLIFTVFTTVGFGDMYPVLAGEMIYVCFVMLVGAIVHSIIVSEMINVVTSVDEQEVNMAAQSQLLEQFADHTELPNDLKDPLLRWVQSCKSSSRHKYDRDRVKALINSSAPRDLAGKLPKKIFQGQLWPNELIQVTLKHGRHVPHRFPIGVALAANRRNLDCGEVVYYCKDYPFNIFLVISGTFAYLAKATPQGGSCNGVTLEACDQLKSRSSKNMRSVTEEQREETMGQDWLLLGFTPYQLMGRGKYFGETEIFSRRLRHSGVVCQQSGSLLVIHRSDFLGLVEEFPVIAEQWKSYAKRKLLHTSMLLQGHKRGRSFRSLAAVQIQRVVRERMCHSNYVSASYSLQGQASVQPMAFRIPSTIGAAATAAMRSISQRRSPAENPEVCEAQNLEPRKSVQVQTETDADGCIDQRYGEFSL